MNSIQLKNDTGLFFSSVCLMCLLPTDVTPAVYTLYKKPISWLNSPYAWIHGFVPLTDSMKYCQHYLDRKNNNIWSVANQSLKDSFHFSNGCAFSNSAQLIWILFLFFLLHFNEIHLTVAEKRSWHMSLSVMSFWFYFYCCFMGPNMLLRDMLAVFWEQQ